MLAAIRDRLWPRLASLRTRFVLLLVLLVLLSAAPWAISLRARALLLGVAHEVELAGSLRYRPMKVALSLDHPERARQIAAEQRRVLEILIDGDRASGQAPCSPEAICTSLQSHLARWNDVLAPVANAAVAGDARARARYLDLAVDEVASIDRMVRRLAKGGEARVQAIVWTGRTATLVLLGIALLVGFGVWDVFGRIRTLRDATAKPSPQDWLGEHARGHDEVATLARALWAGMEELRLRNEADHERLERLRTQQEAMHRLAEDVNAWIGGESPGAADGNRPLTVALERLAAATGFDSVWLAAEVPSSGPEILASTGIEPAQLSACCWRGSGCAPCGELPAGRAIPVDPEGDRQGSEQSGSIGRNPLLQSLRVAGKATVTHVPLRWGERRLGCLGLASKKRRVLSDEQSALVETFGQDLALAIIARRLLVEREQRGRIAALLSTLRTVAEGARALDAELGGLLGHDVLFLALVDETGRVEEAWRISGREVEPVAISQDLEVPGEASAAAAPDRPDWLASERLEGVLFVPLSAGGVELGLLALGRRDRRFDGPEVEAARSIGPLFGAALARMRLEGRLRLSEQLAALGGFTHMLAHEVRNPLNSLALHLELLRRRIERQRLPVDEKEACAENLGVLRGEVERLDALVGEYLAMTRSGGVARFEPVELRALVTEVLEVHSPALSEAGIALEWHLGPSPVLVVGDRAKLQQVLHNLVRNAMEAMAHTTGGRLGVMLRERAGLAELRVRDNGPGVEDPERIFSPSYSTKKTGSGMGLAISLQIARMHRGQLVARHAEGGGAEFVLTLGTAPPDDRPPTLAPRDPLATTSRG
ncbi:MAG: hypothetical protein HYY06_24495 [Deltaproteobacteria bacterium]|nr:hypothetical protein [Deltaproteobacteria bacterium]